MVYGPKDCVHPYYNSLKEDKKGIDMDQLRSLWLIFQGHALQTYNTVTCQYPNEENTKDVSLVSTEKVL